MIRVTWYCARCLRRNRAAAARDPQRWPCGRCAGEAQWTPVSDPPAACGLCGCRDFYREKDFPARLGCVVLIAAVVAFLWTESLWVLIGAAGLDALLYAVLPDRVICHRCLAEYRGVGSTKEFPRYELTTAARYADRPHARAGS